MEKIEILLESYSQHSSKSTNLSFLIRFPSFFTISWCAVKFYHTADTKVKKLNLLRQWKNFSSLDWTKFWLPFLRVNVNKDFIAAGVCTDFPLLIKFEFWQRVFVLTQNCFIKKCFCEIILSSVWGIVQRSWRAGEQSKYQTSTDERFCVFHGPKFN